MRVSLLFAVIAVLPGFFMIDYRRKVTDGSELLAPGGSGVWVVRFAPAEIGNYTWQLRAKDSSGEVTGGDGAFQSSGRHRIHVDNMGNDWVAVTKYTLAGCRGLDRPNLLVCAMKSKSVAVLWLQNRESCWYNHGKGGKVAHVDASTLTLTGLGDGKYRLEWWETWKGEPLRAEQAEARDGRLQLAIPPLATDVAVKIRTAN